jgi:hypothetical protein
MDMCLTSSTIYYHMLSYVWIAHSKRFITSYHISFHLILFIYVQIVCWFICSVNIVLLYMSRANARVRYLVDLKFNSRNLTIIFLEKKCSHTPHLRERLFEPISTINIESSRDDSISILTKICANFVDSGPANVNFCV